MAGDGDAFADRLTTPPVTKIYFATDFLVLWLVFPMLPNRRRPRESPECRADHHSATALATGAPARSCSTVMRAEWSSSARSGSGGAHELLHDCGRREGHARLARQLRGVLEVLEMQSDAEARLEGARQELVAAHLEHPGGSQAALQDIGDASRVHARSFAQYQRF